MEIFSGPSVTSHAAAVSTFSFSFSQECKHFAELKGEALSPGSKQLGQEGCEQNKTVPQLKHHGGKKLDKTVTRELLTQLL